jgi:NAD(P)-dependent dehydrogenase (short-subunit alcohol dehydrogenase family)
MGRGRHSHGLVARKPGSSLTFSLAHLLAYGQSKTACILLSVGVARRWSCDNISSNSLNPGAIATNLQRHTGGLKTPEPYRKTLQQGAATSILLAASPEFEGVTGRYFDDCNEAEIVDERREQPIGTVARYALDPSSEPAASSRTSR